MSVTRQVVGIVLAAGLGTRMKSDLIKVLHPVCGRPMVAYVLEALRMAGAERLIAVVGHQHQRVRRTLGDSVEYALQEQQLGTGHAVMQAEGLLRDWPGVVVVASGDVPLLQATTLMRLIEHHVQGEQAATVLTAVVEDPTGYGRVVREPNGDVVRIVEQKDATYVEQGIREINTGMYAFAGPLLFSALSRLDSDNAQGELYLTDVLGILRGDGCRVGAVAVNDPREAAGVNDRVQLAEAVAVMQERIARMWMLAGVTIVDPSTTYIEPQVRIGRDTVIHPYTYLAGDTEIGEKCSLGPYCQIREAHLAEGVRVGAAVLENCEIGGGAIIAPFSYVRSNTVVAAGSVWPPENGG